MPTTQRVNFPGHDGIILDGRLELPDGKPVCYAIFAHCFTCNKDTLAAFRVCKELAKRGIATLRFDFAGLGDSEGDFAETNFSTSRQDLIAAANWLASHHEAPSLLIGHSLGGTTSLACAGELESVAAVVTIASPSQPANVLHHFGPALDRLRTGSGVSITVAGHEYPVMPQFVDDVESYDMQQHLAGMNKPVLIFDVEGDALVDEQNAIDIQHWCGDESSLIVLSGADHVLTNRQYAVEIAEDIRRFIEIFV